MAKSSILQIEDYEPTAKPIDDTPRPKASQIYAAQKRAHQEDAPPAPVQHDYTLLAAVVGILAIAGVLILAFSQITTRPLVIEHAQPTVVPTAMPTRAAVFVPVPTPTEQPAPTLAPDEEGQQPQTGRGLTIENAVATPESAAEPGYIDQVGAQAPHCVRSCDGQAGSAGGDWVAVPTAEAAYLVSVGAQAPHEVR